MTRKIEIFYQILNFINFPGKFPGNFLENSLENKTQNPSTWQILEINFPGTWLFLPQHNSEFDKSSIFFGNLPNKNFPLPSVNFEISLGRREIFKNFPQALSCPLKIYKSFLLPSGNFRKLTSNSDKFLTEILDFGLELPRHYFSGNSTNSHGNL